MEPTSCRNSIVAPAVRRCLVLAVVACTTVITRAAPATRNFAAEISAARGAWNSSSGQLYALLAQLRQQVGTVLAFNPQVETQNRVVADLKFKMKQALDDMRRGEFCTGCGKTRRQIEAEGDHFPHPGQSIRPATPEELERCRKDYADKIAAAQRRLDELGRQQREASQRASDTYYEYQKRYPVYHQQLLDERNARLAEWQDEYARFETRVRALRSQLVAARTLRDQADNADERAGRQAQVDLVHRLLDTTCDTIRAATARAAQDEREFFAAANADLDRLGTVASEIHAIFGVPDGWYIDKVIRASPPLAYTVHNVPGVDYAARADAAASTARDLLEGTSATSAPAPGKASGDVAARRLLEGK